MEKLTAELNAAGSDKCSVCLRPFDKQPVGSPESCQHLFCLECILQWSQTANTCPVDRISFAFIHQRRRPGGDVQQKIKVKTQRKDAAADDDEEDNEGSNAVICEACGRSDRTHRLLVCSQCESGYHVDCLTAAAVNTGPDADWVCPECAAVPQLADASSAVEEEISEGELTDLLAEVDETPSTSRRLRPSTANRPSAERRRSQRIQSRTSSADPDPRPRTSWHVPKYLLRASQPAVTTDQPAASHHAEHSGAVELKMRKRRKHET